MSTVNSSHSFWCSGFLIIFLHLGNVPPYEAGTFVHNRSEVHKFTFSASLAARTQNMGSANHMHTCQTELEANDTKEQQVSRILSRVLVTVEADFASRLCINDSDCCFMSSDSCQGIFAKPVMQWNLGYYFCIWPLSLLLGHFRDLCTIYYPSKNLSCLY